MRVTWLVGWAALLGFSCVPVTPGPEASARPAIARLLDGKVIVPTKGVAAWELIDALFHPDRVSTIHDFDFEKHDVVIDLDLRGRKVSDALRVVCREAGLDYCATAQVLYISTAKRVALARRGPPQLRISDPAQRRALGRTLSFCTPGDMATQEVVKFFRTISHLDLRVRPDEPDDEQLMGALVILNDVSLLNALYWIAVVSDMELKAEDTAIVLVPRKGSRK